MKFTKRMLAVVLTVALALSLALPAMATVNWNEFRITKQPQNLTIKYRDSFTLSVEVNVPAGVEVEYQWYRNYGDLIEGATAAELHLGPDNSNYPENSSRGTWARYRCRVSAYEKDSGGNIISMQTLESEFAYVTTTTSMGKLYSVTLEPWANAFTATVATLTLTWFVLLPVSPLIYLVFLIGYFGKNFIALF